MPKAMTAEEATSFKHFSTGNYHQVKSQLSCDCDPYDEVFTYARWKALGMQVMRGQHGVKISTFIEVDEQDGSVRRRPWISVVFCRCQVKPR